jgi:hypothetical protein
MSPAEKLQLLKHQAGSHSCHIVYKIAFMKLGCLSASKVLTSLSRTIQPSTRSIRTSAGSKMAPPSQPMIHYDSHTCPYGMLLYTRVDTWPLQNI